MDVQQRHSGQAAVETALIMPVVVLVLVVAIQLVWWGHAQDVVTASVQDGARVASAYGGDTARGVAYARSLLHAGLGSSADEVVLEPREDAAAVTLVARGSWPVLTAPFGGLSLPLRAEARIERERWRP